MPNLGRRRETKKPLGPHRYMANPKHLEILAQGAEEWNHWREDNPGIFPDLSRANLIEANLNGVNLRRADLSKANLYSAILTNANLTEANLENAYLSFADLTNAQLIEADLRFVNLNGANLQGADLSQSEVWGTIFASNDLSSVKGLDTTEHTGPSTIDIDTLYRSGGEIPEIFLRECGVPDSLITFVRSLVTNPIDFYSCFISYSSQDHEFAERLHADLQNKGVRCWFAPEDLRIGDKFRQRIEESIRLHDKLLLILSDNSISSPWVEEEVESALERERKEGRQVLFPVRIDDAVKKREQAWAASLRRMRHIGDFTQWKDHDSYQKTFGRLLRDLKAGAKAAT
ncbi:MAG TPA: toll/interleukin-1 receptor domain-containing protein, partial [Thermoanaerobaculia bacterium]|nr:toll/interleukin-1 receptor domain-containing protein [Thermoanaerobaculia bacterium]